MSESVPCRSGQGLAQAPRKSHNVILHSDSTRIIAMSLALIVIDVQNSFMHRPFWDDTGVPEFLDRIQSLADQAHARDIPVLQVFHVSEAQGPDGAFSRQSGKVTTLPGLDLKPEAVFYKTVHSALFAKRDDGSDLEAWLRSHGVTELLITGIRTEQCCETTTRHASDVGFKVRFVSDATLTFPMTHANGTVYSAADIVARTELVLAGRFAQIVDTAEALPA
jgi:nicotinamidase-related amidase